MIRKLLREALLSESIENYIKVFHGTHLKFVNQIKEKGLISKNYDSASWFMVATDIESAIFHATPNDDEDAHIFEFKVPVTNKKWEGYPYFWPPYTRDNGEKWYALKQPLDSNFITNLHKITYKDYIKQKNKGF